MDAAELTAASRFMSAPVNGKEPMFLNRDVVAMGAITLTDFGHFYSIV